MSRHGTAVDRAAAEADYWGLVSGELPQPLMAMAPGIFVRRVVALVAESYGVEPGEILSERRARRAARPRQVAMWIAICETPLSLPRIGGFFRRDHTTVMHARDVVVAFRNQDADFRAMTDTLRSRAKALLAKPTAPAAAPASPPAEPPHA